MKVVKIKTWDKMEQEYGLDRDGDILTSLDILFSKEMEELLPKNRIIKINKITREHIYYDEVEEYLWKIYGEELLINPDMIEKILNPKDHPQYFI